MIEFKISTDPDQKFSLILNGRRVTLRLRYNVTTDRWSFDMAVDDLEVLHGRRIVTGVNLMKAFSQFDVGALFAEVIVPDSEPDRLNLPNGNVRLYHATLVEIDATVS